MTTRLPRFGTLVVCALVGACAQLIGLSDYEKVDASSGGESGEASGGKGGKTGGATGAGVGGGGAAGRGGAGGLGGKAGQGGRAGSGTAGEDGGVGAEAGDTAGGRPDQGGTGGSSMGGDGGMPPECGTTTEITAGVLLPIEYADEYTSYSFTVEPQLGGFADDEFWVDFYFAGEYDGEDTGTFDLGAIPDNNYATCERCVWLGEDLGQQSPARRHFYVKSGTLTVDPASRHVFGYPRFTLDDVTLVEATIDVEDTHESTPVPGGDCLHLATLGVSVPNPAPAGWTCDPAYYDVDDGCDCGCGVPDPDCTTTFAGECIACSNDGSCSDDSDCFGIDPDNNSQCLANSPWVCSPAIYGDGQTCDCGCGKLDPDCPSTMSGTFCSCADFYSCDPTGNCSTIDPLDNSKCQ